MKIIEFNFNGRKVRGAVAEANGVTWYSVEGEVWTTVKESRATRTRAGEHGDPSLVLAPMPGKIIKVTKSKGERVSKGDVVVVMEAMKMEYTLKALANGTIAEISSSCVVGNQVTLGSMLMRLETEK